MSETTSTTLSSDDLLLAFDLAPVGLCVSRERVIQRCNEAFSAMFGYASPEDLASCPLARLYPSAEEGIRTGEQAYPQLQAHGIYSDERIMQHRSGQLFWCHVSGRSLDRKDPYACTVWMFEDISERRPVTAELTRRERDIAQHLVLGHSSKHIARQLGISPRTVEGHRARLMKKMGAASHTQMIALLVRVNQS